MTAAEIIQRLGGDTVVALALGLRKSTVNSWKRFNSIPDWRRTALLELAARTGVALSTADFPTVEERKARNAA